MRPWMSRSSLLKNALLATLVLTTLAIVSLSIWMFRLDRNIKARFSEKRFAPPVEFYSAPELIKAGYRLPKSYFEKLFTRKNYRRREFGQPIQPGDFSVWTSDQCRSVGILVGHSTDISGDASAQQPQDSNDPNTFDVTNAEPPTQIDRCVAFKNANATPQSKNDDTVQIVALDSGGLILGVFSGATPQPIASIVIEPELFAQYYGENPVLREVVSLGDTPTYCLNALLAIEDSKFLEHPGVSVSGLIRAVITNLRAGRKAQGGSTITQQLVKNYFLTDEKTIRRKLTEIAMAFLVERHASKDEILETYINLIYMGQNGPFQVRGFAAASNHYFGEDLTNLNLQECALLAAVLNSPGLYNPFKNPDRALKRRALVIERMTELGMIDNDDAKAAIESPLPTRPQRSLTEPAPYFVQAVRRQLSENGFDESEGLRIYTTLNLRAQEAAQQAVHSGLERLEKNYPHIQKQKEQGKRLEALLISADPATGYVQALIGGRGYLATQFNRAIDSRRQVGSVMKPFVYLTAFESMTEDGTPYSPLTLIPDKAVTHRWEGQTWRPRNYDGTFSGDVPLFWGLKESRNAATANLGMSVGLTNIVDTARRLGVKSDIKPLPSLTLGAFELSPMEVLQAYNTLAQLGMKAPLSFIGQITDLGGKELFRFEPEPELVSTPEATAELVGVMKHVILSGTARAARLWGFTHPAAGKTGTTNDKKDAWFAGFTPHHSAVVWVGYDDNTTLSLTGSSGAVPIWTNYMKAYASSLPADDFAWPGGVEPATLSPEQLLSYGVPEKKNQPLEPTELIFRRGQAPEATPTPGFFKRLGF